MYTRARLVAHAEPWTPIAGKPRCPKISTQLAAAFTRLAVTNANITGFTT